MTTNEFRKIIASSKQPTWFNSIEILINYSKINFSQKLVGISSIHKFLSQQIDGWNKYENLPKELEFSKKHFTQLKLRIENFVNSRQSDEIANLNSYWRGEQNQLQSYDLNNPFFTYDSPQTEFLIDVYNNFPDSFIGAFLFTIGQHRTNNKNELIGAILAYEFELKDHTELVQRRNKEKSSISKVRNDLREQLNESETQLSEYLSNANKEYLEYVKKIDELKIEKETLVNDWFNNTKDNFSTFDSDSKLKITDLEKTYKEKLKLEEPARYWAERAGKLKIQGWISLGILVIIVFIVVVSLGELLWKTPEQIYTSFFEGDKSAAIRWSIIYITFISFMAFCVKAITKVMFSSFHLARDCEERHTLTYFYLSLLKDSKVDENDRKLIMQSLFSRAETGLLKDDSGPTMPNDIMTKIIGGK